MPCQLLFVRQSKFCCQSYGGGGIDLNILSALAKDGRNIENINTPTQNGKESKKIQKACLKIKMSIICISVSIKRE